LRIFFYCFLSYWPNSSRLSTRL